MRMKPVYHEPDEQGLLLMTVATSACDRALDGRIVTAPVLQFIALLLDQHLLQPETREASSLARVRAQRWGIHVWGTPLIFLSLMH